MPKFDPITRYQMYFVGCRLHGLKPLSPSAFHLVELGDAIKKTTEAMNRFGMALKELGESLRRSNAY